MSVRWETALLQARRGDPSALRERPGEAAAFVDRVLLWFRDPSAHALPALASMGLAGADAGLTAVGLLRVGLAGVLTWDLERVHAARECLAALEPIAGGEAPRVALYGRMLRAWNGLLTGESVTHEGELIEAEALALGDGALVVEAATVTALSLLAASESDRGAAKRVARRASRMARTEGLPLPEYLAHYALARARRFDGHPHLASTILASLRAITPLCLRLWLDWEGALAGERAVPAMTHGGRDAAGELRRYLASLGCGDRAGADRAERALETTLPPGSYFAADFLAVRDACDSARAPNPDGPVGAWARGTIDEPPAALRGLGEVGRDDAVLAWVLATPGAGSRRVLTSGLPESAPHLIDASRSRPGRTETVVAVLALAGSAGLAADDLFQRVYGFQYEPELHAGTFKVLRHRTRTLLGERGTIHTEPGRVVLEVRAPFAVPDPRCTQDLEELVLRALARSGGMSAKEAAAALGVHLRLTQAALRELVEDGACAAARQGRRIEYRVEDTTFSEPSVQLLV